ncbi:MAG: hypothetical protein AUG51_00815 [Acidobacteria bacterium 13_1_20CM_3_53_8]|nr:MAG: hypothetical protein AUG51_00815 [Acidobacteria bacterium 13_1_20CM_3_53_8]
MRFEYYHAGLKDVPKLSVDGTVENSIHFSHWQGNHTPPEVKADTSTEIALNLVAAPDREELTKGIELVTNNHFDTDGVLSVWTVLTGERATRLREKLIAAAEAGDFSEFSNEDGVRASIVIQGSDAVGDQEEAGSPLARTLAGTSVLDDARAYELILPEVERVLTRTSDYEELWRKSWERIASALESFARGASNVEEHAVTSLSIVTLAPEIFSPSGFNPTRHAAPYTAISHYARGHLYLIAVPIGGGWTFRVDYPYYSWAETIVRPRIVRQDFSGLVARLNQLEKNNQGLWTLDASELASAFKFVDQAGVLSISTLTPDRVADEINAFRRMSAASIKDGAAIAGV